MRFEPALRHDAPSFIHVGSASIEGWPSAVPVYSAKKRDLLTCPIPGDVVAGAPTAHQCEGLRARDGRLSSGLWECSEGSFAIRFGLDELVHILEGEVVIHDCDSSFVLRAGDVALFREGYEAVWEIPRYVRKLWVHRPPEVGWFERARRTVAIRTRARRLISSLSARIFLRPARSRPAP